MGQHVKSQWMGFFSIKIFVNKVGRIEKKVWYHDFIHYWDGSYLGKETLETKSGPSGNLGSQCSDSSGSLASHQVLCHLLSVMYCIS